MAKRKLPMLRLATRDKNARRRAGRVSGSKAPSAPTAAPRGEAGQRRADGRQRPLRLRHSRRQELDLVHEDEGRVRVGQGHVEGVAGPGAGEGQVTARVVRQFGADQCEHGAADGHAVRQGHAPGPPVEADGDALEGDGAGEVERDRRIALAPRDPLLAVAVAKVRGPVVAALDAIGQLPERLARRVMRVVEIIKGAALGLAFRRGAVAVASGEDERLRAHRQRGGENESGQNGRKVRSHG